MADDQGKEDMVPPPTPGPRRSPPRQLLPPNFQFRGTYLRERPAAADRPPTPIRGQPMGPPPPVAMVSNAESRVARTYQVALCRARREHRLSIVRNTSRARARRIGRIVEADKARQRAQLPPAARMAGDSQKSLHDGGGSSSTDPSYDSDDDNFIVNDEEEDIP